MIDLNELITPPSPGRRSFVFTIRRSTEPGVPDAMVGVVDPNDPWVQKGALDTGGVIIEGAENQEAIGVFPMSATSNKSVSF